VSPFGDGYYTLTTSQYRTPNGNDIHKVGIPVDIEIEDVQIDDEQMDTYIEFINSNVAADFVQEHPEFTAENIELFMETVVGEDPPLTNDVYRLLLRREYIFQMPFDDRPVADPEYDRVLKRALEFLETGK
jgi:carboxyl-terminal processing protease